MNRKKANILILYSYSESYEKERPHEMAAEIEVEEVAHGIGEALMNIGFTVDMVHILTSHNIKDAVVKFRPELVFNLCEALNGVASGETLAAQTLEDMDMKYTGSGPSTLKVALDKGETKELLLSKGIPSPPFKVLQEGDGFEIGLGFPVIVKPLNEDGSIGISRESVVNDEVTLERRIKYIHNLYNQPAIIESYIDGREFNVGILGNPGDEVVLPLAEMDFSDFPDEIVQICTYKAKWFKDCAEYKGSVPICPAIILPEVEEKIKKVALDAYRTLGVRGYGRIDIRLGADGLPYVIDVNPNPSISRESGLVRASSAAGFTYERLISKIVECTFEK